MKNPDSRYHKRPPEYKVWRRNYAKEYQKTKKQKEKIKSWRKTPAGRKYRSAAASRRAKRHRLWLDEIKTTRGCIDCGFNKWPESLDFDHIDRNTKSFNISQKTTHSKTALSKEIEKCVVRCSNCHRHLTKEKNKNGFRK